LKDISFHHRIIRKDGELRHVYSESKFEFDPAGKPVGLYGIVHDVTKNKEAEEEIRKINDRFQYATKASSDIIWELNFETRQYFLYEGKEKLFGTDREVDWKTGAEGTYIVEGDRERVQQDFSAARRDPSRTLWELEYRLYSATNTELNVINHGIFIRDENGKAIRAIGAITDITEKKKLEADLLEQQKQEQLKIIATAMEAQEKERTAIGQELHDNVNQILVAANMMLSMTKSQPEKASEMIETTKDYLQQAIAENRKIAHVFVAPDLETESLADQLQRLVHNMLGTAGLETTIITGNFREEELDSARKINIYRIAQEQCTNIIKYARATSVRIELINTGDLFKMLISDNGIGMDESKKITGIGLRNINGRLSLFNGSSQIHTSPGKGFTLEISLPLKEK
jgi:signal transduction histidine kinase